MRLLRPRLCNGGVTFVSSLFLGREGGRSDDFMSVGGVSRALGEEGIVALVVQMKWQAERVYRTTEVTSQFDAESMTRIKLHVISSAALVHVEYLSPRGSCCADWLPPSPATYANFRHPDALCAKAHIRSQIPTLQTFA